REKFLEGSIRTINNGFAQDDSYQRLLNQEQRTLSAYTELKIPIFSKLNSIPGVRELDLQLAARTEKYSMITRPASTYIYGTTANLATNVPIVRTDIDYSSTNPTFALRYKPFDSLMLRASYGTAFLPPSYSQLSAPIESPTSTITIVDPRRGNALTDIHPIRGGNPDIEPQGSKNWNLGLVFEPAAVSGLRASLEWFKLEQDNVIVTPTVQQMVDLESQFPGRIVRAAPAPGQTVGAITEVNATLINANKGETAGLDATLEYRLKTDAFGTFSFFAMGTRVLEYKIQNTIAAPLENIVNELGRGGPVRLRVNGGVTWDRGMWSASWLMRYFGSYKQYDVGTNAYVIAQGSEYVPSQQYHDALASYRFGAATTGSSGSWLTDGLEVQLGIKNVFNKAPPFDAYYGVQSIYYSPLGDPRMRSYWMSVSKSF
ncbi:TonB-dependent receptor domain-containing protein, partial [Steroidobacter sp.]|uniref:TonB-dependent receptor domain-containing protein n=1 Tax=Steroidobacter sp. TaxID=1978227 RepID=UPI001A51BF96